MYFLRKIVPGNIIRFYNQSDVLEDSEKSLSILQVIGRVLAISAENKKNAVPFEENSDIIISPKVKHHGRMDFASFHATYVEARRSTLAIIPKLQKLISDIGAGRVKGKFAPALNSSLEPNATTYE